MTINEGIQAHLRADTTLTTIIGDVTSGKGIYWTYAPAKYEKFILFTKISDPQVPNTEDRYERWSFSVYNKDLFTCKDIQEALRYSINNLIGDLGGFNVDLIKHINSVDPIRLDDGTYRAISDFRIYYHEEN